MKVLLTVPSFFPHGYGGGQTYVLQLAHELLRRGDEVAIVSQAPWGGGGPGARVAERRFEGIPVTEVSVDPSALREVERYTELAPPLLEALSGALRRLRPQVIHASGLKAATLLAAREAGIPFVVTAHHPGFVCPNGTLLTPRGDLCTAAASPKACVTCCCEGKRPGAAGRILGRMPDALAALAVKAFGERRAPTKLERGALYPWLVARRLETLGLLAAAPLIVAPSRALSDVLARTGVPRGRMRVIAHGIEPLPRPSRPERGGGPLRLGYVGRIDPAKGLHVLVRALGELPAGAPVELHVFGEAANRWDGIPYREALAAPRHGGRVVEHGPIGPEAVQGALAGIDALVLPSVSFEVFGLTVLEAFRAGVPVIVTRCGGPEELVRDGIDGLVVGRHDPAALAAAIRLLLEEPGLLEGLTARVGRVRTVAEHVDELRPVYEEAIRGG